MPTIDSVFKNIGDNLKGLNKDVADLKNRVNKMLVQDSSGHYLPFSNYGSFGADITASTGVYLATIPKQMSLRSWKQTWHVQSADVSNYWVIGFNSLAGTHFSFTTQPVNGPAAVWNRYDLVNWGGTLLEAWRYVYIDANKVGAPGALYLGTPMLYFI